MTIRDFLRLNLSEVQRTVVQARCPILSRELDHRTFTDNDFVVKVLQGDEEALWLLYFCLHSSYFVRIIRMRSKHECGEPCNLADFQKLPCKWSEKVLDGLFQTITRPGGGVLEGWLGNEDMTMSMFEYLGIYLHSTFHVEMLRRNGFVPQEEDALPSALTTLFSRDARFRSIFLNRWLWGLTEIPMLEEAIQPVLPRETLTRWVDEVDEAVLTSPELAGILQRVKGVEGLRLKSGIPPRAVPREAR